MTEPTEKPQPRRTLRSVVPIAQTKILGDIALTFFAIEDYDDGFDLACRLVTLEGHPLTVRTADQLSAEQDRIRNFVEEARRAGTTDLAPLVLGARESPEVLSTLWPQLAMQAWDDSGFSYHPTQIGGGGAGNGEYRLDFAFKPALASSVRELRIEVTEVGWSNVPPARLRRALDRTDAGPWEFQVDLSAGLQAVVLGDAS